MRFLDNVPLSLKLPLVVAGLGLVTAVLAEVILALAGRGEIWTDRLVVYALCLASVAFGGHWLGQRLGRTLIRAAEAVSGLARGHDAPLWPRSDRRDEVGGLDQSIRALQATLRSTKEATDEAALRAEAMAQSDLPLLLLAPTGEITGTNGAADHLFEVHATALGATAADFHAADLVGQNLAALIGEAPFEGAQAVQAVPIDIDIGSGILCFVVNPIEDGEGGRKGYFVRVHEVSQPRIHAGLVGAIESSHLMITLSTKGEIMALNARVTELLGEEANAWIGHLFADHLTLADDNFDKIISDANAGQMSECEVYVVGADGAPCTWVGHLSPVKDRLGRVLRLALVLTDVTEARALQASAEAERRRILEGQADVVERLRGAMRRLAEGDLTVQIDTNFPADYEELRVNFNRTANELRSALRAVSENADSIHGEVADISNAAADLSQRTERQAATLEQTAAAIEELTASVSSAAESAKQAKEVVLEAKSNAEKSGEVVNQAVAAMGEISASSEKISKIIGVIDDIAFQTNLLALNAGVEAARAGDAGRGFAVVASEVRALAQRSSDAAKEINGLISSSSAQVRHGVDLVGEAGAALREIVGFVSDISEHVSGIAHSAQEQSSGLGEINAAMTQLDQVTQQNAAMFEETTAASQALNGEADKLIALIQRFNTGQAVAQASFPARGRLSGTIIAPAAIDGNVVLDLGDPNEDTGWEEF